MFKTHFYRFIFGSDKRTSILVALQLLLVHHYGYIAYSGIIFPLVLVYSLAAQHNYFWSIGIILNVGLGIYAPLNLLMGIMTCIDPFTTILYIFVVVDQFLLPW
jgi:hypothetical protein